MRVGYLTLAGWLSHISNQPRVAYLTWVAMWGRLFRQQANIGIT